MGRSANFNDFIKSFEKKLETVIIDEISPESYCRKYLAYLLAHQKYFLSIYADVLNKWAIHSKKDIANSILVDYGSGIGLLGLFAKFCGFKKVILVDVDSAFIGASQILSKKLNIELNGFITGGIHQLQSYGGDESFDAIVGTDVIEHIYDLDEFFIALQKINPFMVSVFTTGSNPENFLKVKALKKIQEKDEYVGGYPGDHLLFGAIQLEPFLNIRKEIILNLNADLTEEEVVKLAAATRGMDKADIIRAVNEYRINKRVPLPSNDTNTCNPFTGSWTERILSLTTYRTIYRKAGFTCEIHAGFYNEFENGFSALVKKMLNLLITFAGNKISPYIVIVGHSN